MLLFKRVELLAAPLGTQQIAAARVLQRFRRRKQLGKQSLAVRKLPLNLRSVFIAGRRRVPERLKPRDRLVNQRSARRRRQLRLLNTLRKPEAPFLERVRARPAVLTGGRQTRNLLLRLSLFAMQLLQRRLFVRNLRFICTDLLVKSTAVSIRLPQLRTDLFD